MRLLAVTRCLGAVVLTATLATCRSADEPPLRRMLQPSTAAQLGAGRPIQGSRHRRPDEDLLVALAQEDSTNAGFFADSLGGITVLITRNDKEASARARMQRNLYSGGLGIPLRAGMQVRTRHAEFSFQQLSDWRDAVSDSALTGPDGIISVDLDEARNRVTVGIDRRKPQALAVATRRLTELGIPMNAVVFDDLRGMSLAIPVGRRALPLSVTSLDYSAPDTVGGGFAVGTQALAGTGGCTLSIVGDRSGSRGFIGAAHCSPRWWSMDGATFFAVDSSYFPNWKIGRETVDPTAYSCSFWNWWGCDTWRNADANFVALDSTGRRGAIARTMLRASGANGSRTIVGSNPWINVRSVEYALTQGIDLDKMGRVSGWTHGSLTGTCIDIVPDGSHKIYCTGRASVFVRPGDSGSPVFLWDGADGATYYGVVSACGISPCLDGYNDMYFSSYQQVAMDLGSINVISEITVGTPTISGALGGGVPTLSWSAVGTTNTLATTVYKVYRSVWDASTYTWSQADYHVGSTTSTSYTDGGAPVALYAYAGGAQPAECTYTSIRYYVVAYNAGISAASNVVYFQGAANGPRPEQFSCP